MTTKPFLFLPTILISDQNDKVKALTLTCASCSNFGYVVTPPVADKNGLTGPGLHPQHRTHINSLAKDYTGTDFESHVHHNGS